MKSKRKEIDSLKFFLHMLTICRFNCQFDGLMCRLVEIVELAANERIDELEKN